MKALSRKTREQKDRDRVDRYITENYEEVIYEAISMNAGNVVKQTAVEFLLALSLHGYGAKRLNDAFEWFLAITNLPDKLMGQTISAEDTIKVIHDKYGIDFEQINPHYQSYADFCRERRERESKNEQ